MPSERRFVFHEALSACRQSTAAATRSMGAHLGRLCEDHVTPGHDEYIDYGERRAPWWLTRPGGRRLPAAIQRLAAGGILLEPRYGEAAAAILRTVVENRIAENCAGTNYGRPYRTWRDNPLDAGAVSLGLAIGLDLLAPSLEPDELTAFGAYLVPFVDYILENPPDPEEERPDLNTALIGYVGTALLALVLNDIGVLDDARRAESTARGRRRALLFLERGHDGDGAFFEGPGYGSASAHYSLFLGFALARRGDGSIVEHEGLARVVEGYAYELVPATGQLNQLNDCSRPVNVSWVPLVAAAQQSGLAQWLWQRRMGWPPAGNVEDFDWTDMVLSFLLYHDPEIEPTPPAAAGLPRTRHFRQRGLVDVRSGWEPDDALLSFLCDVYPAGGHRQADRNQFAFHALGESFAIDSGYGLEPLPDTTEVLRRGAMGEAHNLPLVHGRMQERGQVEGDGIVRLDLEGPWAYIESEAGHSYGPDWTFRRRVVALPGPDRALGCVVVADRMTFALSEPRPMLTWLLHTAAGNAVELERDRFTIVGARQGNRCQVQIATPWPGRWREEEFLDHSRLRYDWFFDPLFCVVVLVPYRRGQAPPEIEGAGSAAGCSLEVRIGDLRYAILAAGPGQQVELGQVAADAELAVVGFRADRVDGFLASGGTALRVGAETLVDEPGGTAYLAARSRGRVC